MTYSIWTRIVLATVLTDVEDELQDVMEPLREKIMDVVIEFLGHEVSPKRTFEFEERLQALLRELGQVVTSWTYNHVEPDDPETLPHDVYLEGSYYRRINRKTANRNVSTRFGKIILWRFGYRDWQRGGGEPTLFPLERSLGLMGGATPALTSAVGRYFADAGATQEIVLKRLRCEHGVIWGTKKLREVTAYLAEIMQPLCAEAQAAKILAWLKQAFDTKGNRRPVMSVGRDGITLGMQPGDSFEVATAATVSIYDRRGNRVGTVYLAQPPELGQQTMTDQLTSLIKTILAEWDGPIGN